MRGGSPSRNAPSGWSTIVDSVVVTVNRKVAQSRKRLPKSRPENAKGESVHKLELAEGKARLPGVEQVHHCAVVAQGGSAAEIGYGGEDILERVTLGGDGFQARILEEISTGIFGFGDAIGDEHETVARFQAGMVALVDRIFQ